MSDDAVAIDDDSSFASFHWLFPHPWLHRINTVTFNNRGHAKLAQLG